MGTHKREKGSILKGGNIFPLLEALIGKNIVSLGIKSSEPSWTV